MTKIYISLCFTPCWEGGKCDDAFDAECVAHLAYTLYRLNGQIKPKPNIKLISYLSKIVSLYIIH